jgi:hypothetical protein
MFKLRRKTCVRNTQEEEMKIIGLTRDRERERKWRNNPSTSILMDAVNRNSGQVQAL